MAGPGGGSSSSASAPPTSSSTPTTAGWSGLTPSPGRRRASPRSGPGPGGSGSPAARCHVSRVMCHVSRCVGAGVLPGAAVRRVRAGGVRVPRRRGARRLRRAGGAGLRHAGHGAAAGAAGPRGGGAGAGVQPHHPLHAVRGPRPRQDHRALRPGLLPAGEAAAQPRPGCQPRVRRSTAPSWASPRSTPPTASTWPTDSPRGAPSPPPAAPTSPQPPPLFPAAAGRRMTKPRTTWRSRRSWRTSS